MAGRGAWRLDGGARRVETIAPSSPPPVLLGRRPTSPCNAPTLPFATVPVGAALETPAASNLRAPTRPMARAPVGNAKTHSTPSHYDGVEHKWWLPSPPPHPWVSSRRPKHHIRRRLRRAARCVGAIAAAPAQHARALRAFDPCCAGTSWPDLGVRAHLLRSARASRRAAKGARRSMANGEMVGEQHRPPTRLEPAAAGRGGARMRALRSKKVGGQKVELLVLSAGLPERGFTHFSLGTPGFCLPWYQQLRQH